MLHHTNKRYQRYSIVFGLLLALFSSTWVVGAQETVADSQLSSPSGVYLVAQPSQNGVFVSWQPLASLPDEPAFYNLERLNVAANTSNTLLTNSQNLTHTDGDTLQAGNVYCYSVVVYNQSNQEVGRSNQSCITAGHMSLQISPAIQTVIVGQSISLPINIVDAADLYGIQVGCSLQGSSLTLLGNTIGDFFAADHLVGRDNLTSTQWEGALSQRNPAPALSDNGLLVTLNADATTVGTTLIVCSAQASDRDGGTLPLNVSGALIEVEYPVSDINGSLRYQTRTVHNNIAVTASGPNNQSAVTAADGTFNFDGLQTGEYIVQASAAGHLDACHTETLVENSPMIVPLITLQAGDADNNGTVNMIDVVALTTIFGSAPNNQFDTDFNTDGIVDIFDFTPLGGNFGETTNCGA